MISVCRYAEYVPAARICSISDAFFSTPEKINRAPISTPTIVPGGLNDCEKFNLCSDVAGSPNCAINGFDAVSKNEAPLPTVNNATRNGRYCPLTAAGIAMMKYPRKFAVCTSCALTGDSSNDFLNCCTRMSVRLFDIPHRKNSTVTSENRTIWPTGNTGCF